MADAGIDLENPKPLHVFVGVLTSGFTIFFSMAEMKKKFNSCSQTINNGSWTNRHTFGIKCKQTKKQKQKPVLLYTYLPKEHRKMGYLLKPMLAYEHNPLPRKCHRELVQQRSIPRTLTIRYWVFSYTNCKYDNKRPREGVYVEIMAERNSLVRCY